MRIGSITLTSIFALFMSLPVFGAWASSGGKILRYASNPWFLENTASVTYCIDLDREHFGVTGKEAAILIQQTFKNWKKLFTHTSETEYAPGEILPYGQVRLATQSFELVDCSEQVDIRFQLGHLTEEQQRGFSEPKEFVGAAILTDYDLKTLRGKGFVYIAPSSGPLVPNLDNVHPKVWKVGNNAALKAVLLHEIGHIFGVKHQPEGWGFALTQSGPELIMSSVPYEGGDSDIIPEDGEVTVPFEEWVSKLYNNLPLIFNVQENQTITHCVDDPGKNLKFGNIVYDAHNKIGIRDSRCFRTTLVNNPREDWFKIVIFAGQSKDSLSEVGTIEGKITINYAEYLANVSLPRDQTVFSFKKLESQNSANADGYEKSYSSVLGESYAISKDFVGTYTSKDLSKSFMVEGQVDRLWIKLYTSHTESELGKIFFVADPLYLDLFAKDARMN